MIWAVLSLALGGVLKGATGAGAPVVAVPVIAMTHGVDVAVVTMMVPNLLSNLWQGWQFRADALPPQFTWTFAGAGMAGAVAGTWLLANLPATALSLMVAAGVFAYIGLRLARPDLGLGLRAGTALAGPVGLVAGVLQGATGVSAPVSLTFLNAMRLGRGAFIGTVSIFFAAMTLAQLPSLALVGLLSGERLAASAAAFVIVSAFMPVGGWLGARISKAAFDRGMLVLLALVAIRILADALGIGPGGGIG